MSRLLAYLRRHWLRLCWGGMMLLCTNLAALAIPQLFAMAVDGISSDIAGAHLRDIALTMLLLAAAGAVFRVLSRVHLFYVGRDVEQSIRDDFYRHLNRQPPAFYAQYPTGDLMSRATYDLTQVRLLLGPGLLNLINAVIAYVATIPLMLMISPLLTSISLGVMVPSFILTQRLSRRLYRSNQAQQQAMGDMGNFVQENLAGAHVVRAFGMEAQQLQRFGAINERCYRTSIELSWVRSYIWRLMATLAGVGTLLTLYVGAGQVMRQEISLGELVALSEYLALLAWPSFALGWVISLVQRGMAAMQRINQIFEVEPAVTSGTAKPENLRPSLKVEHLTLTLDDRPVLQDLSFVLPAGHTLGVVGAIGAGKSVLVHALVRQLEVAPGTISVDGHDVTDLELDTLWKLFGFVHQTPVLFSKTVAENVAFGRPSASRKEVQRALEVASFWDDLTTLPAGMDTQVGERGITLSGGQKQRTAIARAVLLDPPILVLDDALSSVDAETEGAILRKLTALRRGKTNVIVAHRMSAVQHADEIIVLEAGRVIERGTHRELLALNGAYAQMCRRQELESHLDEQRSSLGEEKTA